MFTCAVHCLEGCSVGPLPCKETQGSVQYKCYHGNQDADKDSCQSLVLCTGGVCVCVCVWGGGGEGGHQINVCLSVFYVCMVGFLCSVYVAP